MPRDRKNSAEPVWLEKDGCWYLQKQYHGERKTFRAYIPGPRGYADCLAQAKKWSADKRRMDAFGETSEIPYSIRVRQLGEKWIEELKLTTSRDYYMQYAGYLSHYVYPRYGSRRVSGLVEQDLQDIILGAFSRPFNRDKKPLSHKTLTKIRACLVSFLKYARKSGVSTLLPEGLYIPKSAPKGQKFPLLKSDLKVLFSDPTTMYYGKKSMDWYIHAYRFSVIVGLRPGELAHIQYKRDIKGAALLPARRYQRARGFYLREKRKRDPQLRPARSCHAGGRGPAGYAQRGGRSEPFSLPRARWGAPGL